MGNQLLCAYRKYLLAYESVHAPRDLPPPDPPQRPVRLQGTVKIKKAATVRKLQVPAGLRERACPTKPAPT